MLHDCYHQTIWQWSPSLRGSGLKLKKIDGKIASLQSPSLRGSGLKLQVFWYQKSRRKSPSLRGSGLKFPRSYYKFVLAVSPSLRGSGLKSKKWEEMTMDDVMSPSLRGSGLKFQHMDFYFYDFHVSLFTREWIEISNPSLGDKPIRVSLFTREWIEIPVATVTETDAGGLPLYEGVDWNIFSITLVTKATCASPSLRGSGLKYQFFLRVVQDPQCLPLYEGVDWNCGCDRKNNQSSVSPSLRGSGLKFSASNIVLLAFVSPSLRGSGLKSKTN